MFHVKHANKVLTKGSFFLCGLVRTAPHNAVRTSSRRVTLTAAVGLDPVAVRVYYERRVVVLAVVGT